mmetsp:Transcript_83489/g.235401  ORF Transcript_83489/g.235401 Transcript_83489/m.235401 type:complete len:227 (+) Transcript_83489:179-859(+)
MVVVSSFRGEGPSGGTLRRHFTYLSSDVTDSTVSEWYAVLARSANLLHRKAMVARLAACRSCSRSCSLGFEGNTGARPSSKGQRMARPDPASTEAGTRVARARACGPSPDSFLVRSLSREVRSVAHGGGTLQPNWSWPQWSAMRAAFHEHDKIQSSCCSHHAGRCCGPTGDAAGGHGEGRKGGGVADGGAARRNAQSHSHRRPIRCRYIPVLGQEKELHPVQLRRD